MRYSSFLTIMITLCTLASGAFAGSAFDRTAELLPADVYPSRRAAIERLVAQAIRELREDPNFSAEGMACDITGQGATSSELNDLVAAPLRSAFSFAQIDQTNEPKPSERMMSIGVSVDSSENRVSVSFGGGKTGTQTLAARYVEKPWADDWATFANSKSSARWICTSSPTPAASAEEAMLLARRAAVGQLLPLVQTEMRARSARKSGVRVPVTNEWLESRVTDSLLRPSNDGILVVDRFVQKFSRPYGDVWQAQILIDASPKIIAQLADSYSSAASRQFGRKAAGFGAITVMAAVIGLLYAFVNAVTKGYFMWRLRAVALLAAIATVLVVFAVT